MNLHTNLTQQELIEICNQIIITSTKTIADNPWVFYQYNAPMSTVLGAFVVEFVKPFVKPSSFVSDISYRQGLHIVCSEIYQSQQN